MTSPERVDLRVSSCFPSLPVAEQGDEQSCLVHSFSAALHCLKTQSNLEHFPASRVETVDFSRVFREALSTSPDRSKGTSFEDVVQSLLRVHARDLTLLGWRLVYLQNSVEQCKRRLREGLPIVAGYQVNARIDRFHTSATVCREHGYLLPSFSEDRRPVAAHAVLILGFDDAFQSFLARNSWGPEWGVDGHFLIRYKDLEDGAFFTDLMSFVAAAK